MSSQTTGRAALVANNLPTAKTVSNATNATPIVVTTTTNHGLHTNEAFTISGVAGNLAANGTFVAGLVTPTTVVLLAYPAGTSVAGTGAYTSGGTLQSLGFGLTVPVPNDLTDAMRAGLVNVPFEALLDFTAYLMAQAGASSSTFVRRAGDTMTGNLTMTQGTSVIAGGSGTTLAGTWVASGNWSFNGGSVQFHNGTVAEAGSFFQIVGRCVPRSARVAVADGNKTIGVATGSGVDYAGKRFVVVNNPFAPRTITLKSTTVVPSEGETMEVLCVALQGSTTEFSFKREDATIVATFTAPAGIADERNCWAEFEYVSGVWRLGANNGSSWDPIGTAAYGVLPGDGA